MIIPTRSPLRVALDHLMGILPNRDMSEIRASSCPKELAVSSIIPKSPTPAASSSSWTHSMMSNSPHSGHGCASSSPGSTSLRDIVSVYPPPPVQKGFWSTEMLGFKTSKIGSANSLSRAYGLMGIINQLITRGCHLVDIYIYIQAPYLSHIRREKSHHPHGTAAIQKSHIR